MADKMLSVHEAPESEEQESNGELIQSEELKKLAKKIEKMFSKAKRHRKKFDYDWLENYEIFMGKQWKEQRPSYRHSEVINLVFQSIQHSVPIIADIRPQFSFLPLEPTDYRVSEVFNEVVNAEWERHGWSQETLEMLYDGHIYGTGAMGCFFDSEADLGIGAINIKSQDPFYCYPDPSAKDVNKECDYFIYAEPQDIDRLKRQYPKFAAHIKPDVNQMMENRENVIYDHAHRSPTNPLDNIETDHSGPEAKNKALVITTFMKDESIEESEDFDEDNKKPVFKSKKKYPHGRRVVKIGQFIVEDGPNPYEDGKYPWVVWRNYLNPRMFWGISEVLQSKGPQRVFNKLVSFALDVVTLMGNPIWVVDDTADIDTENLFNQPGLIVEKAAGSEVRRESGVQLQPFVLDLITRMETWFNGMTGTADVSQGVRPAGVTAASAIDLLQEAAETRLRQKSRNLDATLQQLGQMYLSRFLQFYSAPRVFRLTKSGEVQKFLKMEVSREEKEMGDPDVTIRIKEIERDDEGEFKESDKFQEFKKVGQFDVRVNTGSGLPFAKQNKVNKAFELFDRQVIDDQELLKIIDFPNWEAVLQRVTQKKQEAAQAQAQAAPQK